MPELKPVLRYPGAKWNLAKWIIANLPPHKSYLEPFFGSGAVFFNKTPSRIETINDIDGQVVNLFKTIRDNGEDLVKKIVYTPWSRQEYYESYEPTEDNVENARRFLVRTWQAFGSTTSKKTGWRNETQGKQGKSAYKVWGELSHRISSVCERLKNAQIENAPAVEVIERFKHKDVLIYADPPYPLSTRAGEMYADEMTDEDHFELLEVLAQHPGPVILSGYDCDLYNELLGPWQRKTTKAIADGGREREEVLWLNPIAADSYSRMILF